MHEIVAGKRGQEIADKGCQGEYEEKIGIEPRRRNGWWTDEDGKTCITSCHDDDDDDDKTFNLFDPHATP